jgi:hypothetical protein
MSADSKSFSLDGDASLWSHRSPFLTLSSHESKSTQTFYAYGVTGGILRLSPETPSDVLGLCTDSIATCFVVILVGKNSKTSLLHMTHPIHLQSIEQERAWIGAIDKAYIAYNSACLTLPSRLENCCDALEEICNKKPLLIKMSAGIEGARIAYRREDKTCFIPDFSKINRHSHAPNLNMYAFYLNGYFLEKTPSFIHYDGKHWQQELSLVTEVLAIYEDSSNQLMLNDDTPSNRGKLKNILIRKALKQEPGYFFDIIRQKLIENPATASAALDDVVKCFFIYVKEANKNAHEIAQRFTASLDLQTLVDQINAEAGWVKEPSM